MTGLTRQQAAEAVASLFGTNAVHPVQSLKCKREPGGTLVPEGAGTHAGENP